MIAFVPYSPQSGILNTPRRVEAANIHLKPLFRVILGGAQELPEFECDRLGTARAWEVRNPDALIGHINSPSLLCGNATMAKAGGESILSGNGES